MDALLSRRRPDTGSRAIAFRPMLPASPRDRAMIESLALILLCQLAGEAVSHGTGWPLPGPVLGMALLLGLLLLRDAVPSAVPAPIRHSLGDGRVEGAANGLLAHLSLLFVPAGVGVVGALDVLGSHGAALALALLASTAIGLGVTALVFAALARREDPP